MDLSPVIVVAGFNRALALKRLLTALNLANYGPDRPKLIISLDGGATLDTIEAAKSFKFAWGECELVLHPENLGLRKHILWCGGRALIYGSAIVFEDDILPDGNFYLYARKVLSYSRHRNAIAGCALYSPELNEFENLPFSPLKGEYSAYLMQLPCSWGQAWTAEQWEAFISWYSKVNSASIGKDERIHREVSLWSERSWKKYFAQYLVEESKYFLYPHDSYATNCADSGGVHLKNSSTIFQVTMLQPTRSEPKLSMPEAENLLISYDAYLEIEPRHLALTLGVSPDDLVVDLQGSKPLSLLKKKKLSLTVKNTTTPISTISLGFRPLPLNVLLQHAAASAIVAKLTLSDDIAAEGSATTRSRQHAMRAMLLGTDFRGIRFPLFLLKSWFYQSFLR